MRTIEEIISKTIEKRNELQQEISALDKEVEDFPCPICGEPFEGLDYIVFCAGGCERYICLDCAVDMEDEYVCVECQITKEANHEID